jgi:hypothetical protein
MDVPKRIVDDPSADALARALIEDARIETAGGNGKARALAALGLAGGAGLASTSTAFAGLKALGAGVLAAGALASGAWLLTRAEPTAPVPPSSSLSMPPPLAPSAATMEVLPLASVSTPDVAPRNDAPRSTPKSTPRASAVPVAPTDASTSASTSSRLAEEARNLELARRALEGHRASDALSTLDRYARDFPRGELRPEATALRVEALAASGDHVSARALGGHFLTHYPGHPAVPRVRRAMGDTNF